MIGNPLQIALIGDRNGEYLPHVSAEASISKLSHELSIEAEGIWVPTGKVKETDLHRFDLIWSGSGPYLDPEGTMEAIRFARENSIPFIGTCSGFKYTIIELAKNVCRAQNPEEYISFKESCGTEYKDLQIQLNPTSKARSWYEVLNVIETSHCRFEINPAHQEELIQHFTFAGNADDGRMVIAELSDHPFFVATLFLPQLNDKGTLLKKWMSSAAQLI